MSTITRTETHASIRPQIRFDTEYIQSLNGKLKIALLVLGIINVIAINSGTVLTGSGAFFNTILALSWWFTLAMLVVFLFHIPEKFYTLPWLPVEIGVLTIISLLYFIASLMVILQRYASHTVAGVFGFITTVLYFYSAYLKWKQWKNGDLAQGSIVSRSTTTITQSSAFPA